MSIVSYIRAGRLRPQDLTLYADGSLRGRRRRLLEAHLRGCEACRRFVEQTARTLTLLRDLDRPALPTELRRGLDEAFAGWAVRRC